MSEKYTKARFWKCALQVNPAGYIAYRGREHGLSEEEYNNELLRAAMENDIHIIGLADHENVECIRYALERNPIGKNAQKQHEDIIKANLGKSKARIELKISSSNKNGRSFIIARRYGESASVTDQNGRPSSFSPFDLLPDIEIYGQNEIIEITQDKKELWLVLKRFLKEGNENETLIKEAIIKLAENRKKIIEIQKDISSIEDEVTMLPKLEEEIKQFKELGLEDKLQIIPLLETEKRL